jgi:hypothetical protein
MVKVALLIGVSQYGAGFNQLPAAAKDVEEMQRVLQHQIWGILIRYSHLSILIRRKWEQ